MRLNKAHMKRIVLFIIWWLIFDNLQIGGFSELEIEGL